jgi:hypothetical protein
MRQQGEAADLQEAARERRRIRRLDPRRPEDGARVEHDRVHPRELLQHHQAHPRLHHRADHVSTRDTHQQGNQKQRRSINLPEMHGTNRAVHRDTTYCQNPTDGENGALTTRGHMRSCLNRSRSVARGWADDWRAASCNKRKTSRKEDRQFAVQAHEEHVPGEGTPRELLLRW